MHELEDKKLKKRSVVHIDIANDSVASADFKADEDPKTFKSEKTGRGPLSGDWKASKNRDIDFINSYFFQKSCEPVMTAYKLVTIQFKWWGLQVKKSINI